MDLEAAAEAGPGPAPGAEPDLRRGSCLEILPTLPEAAVSLVVTSPPYCNRYDYTRTYALELVYLGLGAEDVRSLRQAMLSCPSRCQVLPGRVFAVSTSPGRSGLRYS